ncbi:M23 family metallopeptidase [Flavobacterium sp. CBA20B-1]|uniref:M23 family metallopeptidase n=1 Tax=unclassified Flavobacterium TaxID=196869 RepID=UPI0022250D30|nr:MULTISPECIES: M23 family metallopeptidase [unclassified Flavobacterium]WCM42057.1 M23 family metallopeptidase [Flavobacterium sp. CBA20B-1]
MIYRFLFFALFCWNSFAQTNTITEFSPPIKIPLLVAGTFGELRPNHFHAGIDFTANYKIGDPIFAPADGVVNRIKVSSFGYGKALYVKHNNGYTTVYGHLNAYGHDIANYVNKHHYELKQFEMELFPLASELPVKKGDIIGYIGNTGGSGGPHLHYEIRNTRTEHILNPLVFSLKEAVTDTEQPIINGVFVYPLTNETIINNSHSFFEVGLNKVNNTYRSETIQAKGVIGFGINTHDTQNKSRGKNGVYKLVTHLNGSKYFEVVFDEFSFDESKYLNEYIDYKYYQQSGNRIQKLFILNELPLNLIKTKKNNGKIVVDGAQDLNFKIEVFDVHNNKQTIEIPIKYHDYELMAKSQPEGKYIDYLKDYVFQDKNVSVEWDARTFFEDVYLKIDFIENGLVLHKDEYALQKNINIKIILPEDYPNKDQTFIGKVDGKKIKFFDTWKRENDFRIRTKELGTYQLVTDKEKPIVHFLNNQSEFSVNDNLVFEIEDKLSGIGTFNGYLNNEWILLEYDYKTKKLIHKLTDKKFNSGSNTLRLEVADRVGNNTTFEQTIVVN